MQETKPLRCESAGHQWAARSERWQAYRPKRYGAPKKFAFREPLILCGHAAHIRVDHGSLLIRNGFTHYPQRQETIRLFPGEGNLPDRIVMLDGSGGMSFDALAWMTEQRITFVRLDYRGRVDFIGGTTAHTAKRNLVERQVRLNGSNNALDITRQLLRNKFEACIETIEQVFPRADAAQFAVSKMTAWKSALTKAQSISKILGIEGGAAIHYYIPWNGTPLRWTGLSKRPIPASWHQIGARTMTWRKKSRNAHHPVNAMLNYGYGMLISQMRAEIVAAGLDPSVGVVHSNKTNAVPLVYDLMEPLRPVVDRKVLEFALSHEFSAGDFLINKVGGCRINPQLARVIAGLLTDLKSDHITASFIRHLQSRKFH